MAGEMDRQLRENRLVFYAADVDRINKVIEKYQLDSMSKCNLLIDKDGHCVTQVGEAQGLNADTVSALVAACFTSARELAKILGESEFTSLTHQGKKESMQLTMVADRAILATIFDEKTTLGRVTLYVKDVATKLGTVFEEIRKRKKTLPEGGTFQGFDESAKGALDDMFGAG